LFLSAWIIYLADRFGDSLSLVPGQRKSVRQQFCLRHKSIWVVSIICVAVVDLIVVFRAVNYETAVLGAVLVHSRSPMSRLITRTAKFGGRFR
jgi:hypothetical protein